MNNFITNQLINELTETQKLILNKIKEYENISLFFHEAPDFDALGSCYGLKEFINDNFPNKKVEIIGLDTLEDEYLSTLFYKCSTDVKDEFICKSLGIISDTGNEKRVYSQKHKLCMETIRVDHHVEVENFANLEWIDPTYPSTCSMWTEFFINTNLKISSDTAKFLYSGVVTDTGRFLYYNTTPKTYLITYVLISTGFNREEVHSAIYTKTTKQILFSSYITKRIKTKNRIAYCIIPKNAFKKFKIKIQYSMVNLLANIKGIDVWTTLYYDYNLKIWKGSIRSVSIPINHIAQKFNGGGHMFASGFKLSDKKEYKNVLDEIEKYLESLKK